MWWSIPRNYVKHKLYRDNLHIVRYKMLTLTKQSIYEKQIFWWSFLTKKKTKKLILIMKLTALFLILYP